MKMKERLRLPFPRAITRYLSRPPDLPAHAYAQLHPTPVFSSLSGLIVFSLLPARFRPSTPICCLLRRTEATFSLSHLCSHSVPRSKFKSVFPLSSRLSLCHRLCRTGLREWSSLVSACEGSKQTKLATLYVDHRSSSPTSHTHIILPASNNETLFMFSIETNVHYSDFLSVSFSSLSLVSRVTARFVPIPHASTPPQKHDLDERLAS